MNISDFFSRYGQYYGEKTAVVYGDKRLSFIEMAERVHRLANSLTALGVKGDDKVGLLADNCSQFLEVFFARYELGVVEVTLNTKLNPNEWARQVNEAGLSTLFVGKEQVDSLWSVRSELRGLKNLISISGESSDSIDYEALIASGSSREPGIDVDISPSRLQRIVFTGGTTGVPKGVMLSRSADFAQLRNMLIDLVPDLCAKDIFLGLQPMYHAIRPFFFPCWMRGATHVIVSDFSPKTILDAVDMERVTAMKTVPTVLIRLMADPDLQNHDLKSIRTIIYGGAPMAAGKVKEAVSIFGPVLVQNYGQTESAMTVCHLRKEDHVVEGDPRKEARLASVGRPYSWVECKLVNDSDEEVAPGEMGELIVRGDHNMMGYLGMPEETEKSLKDGWVHTRDLARMDEEGFIFLIDRKGDGIKSGAEFVYPGEVEQVLYRHPAVLEACVFGIPDDQWGESVTAAVALKPGASATEEELIRFCKERIARYKSPKSIAFHDSLPKSGVGKILRRELSEPYWKGQARRIN